MFKMLSISILLSSSLIAFDFGSALKSAGDLLKENSESKKEVTVAKEYIVPNYDKKTALLMADIADGVFLDDFGKQAFLKRGFNYEGYVTAKEGIVDLQFAYGSKGNLNSKMDIVISVRGSKEKMDWITDINFIPTKYDASIDEKITVHSGFLQSAKLLVSKESSAIIAGITLKKLIELNAKGDRNDQFFIAGHSLGGAVATLYSTMLIDRKIKKENLTVYTFGAPPISMDEGSQKEQMSSTSLEGKFTAISDIAVSSVMGSEKGTNYYIDRYNDKIEIFRVYDNNDIVPKLISPARHLGTPVLYGESLQKKDLLNTDKLWEIHWMDNCINQVKNFKPKDPSSKSNGLIDLAGFK